MTRSLLGLIYNVLAGVYDFFIHFWATFGTYLQVIPIVKDVFTELIWLSYFLALEWYSLIYWWDNVRKEATFLSDFYNVLLALRCGFEDYVLLSGDPENLGRIVYYPASFLYRFVQGLESVAYTLSEWYANVITAISNILDSDAILALIKGWFPWLTDLGDWFAAWVSNVFAAVNSWWSDTSTIVEGWIAAALQTATDLITAVSESLATLQTAWDAFKARIPPLDALLLWFSDWWTEILTPLTTWWDERLLEVDTLINDTIQDYFPFYDDLVALWTSVTDFFTNPLTWLVTRLESWFWESE